MSSYDHVNFNTLEDGSVQRTSIGEINNTAILKACENYKNTGETYSRIKTDDGQIVVNLTEYNQEGLSWLVITAIPESIVTAGIYRTIELTMILTLLAMILSGLIFLKLANLAFKSEILNKAFRVEDIIARIGGDEFIILLKNTRPHETHRLMERVKTGFSNENILSLKSSISMGCDIKTGPRKNISDVLKDAEDAMYRDKTINCKIINSSFIESIIVTLHNRNPRELRYSQNVGELSQRIGRAMDLSEAEIKWLKEAGFLHDIGKVVLDNEVLNQNRVLTEEERKLKHEHAVAGYRVLNMFAETLDLAESVFAHHERWDGSGYPKGLKGEEIPKLARIIALAESYDAMINPGIEVPRTSEEAIQEIKNMSGRRFDPYIVNVFVEMMEKTKQIIKYRQGEKNGKI